MIAGFAVLAALLYKSTVVENPRTAQEHTLEATLHPPRPVEHILRQSCYDCHSNDTNWPWYAHLRPVANWIGRDVSAARASINFSEWSIQTHSDPALQQRNLNTSCSLMEAGMMPPHSYLYIHPGSKPSASEVRQFCNWARQAPATTQRDSGF